MSKTKSDFLPLSRTSEIIVQELPEEIMVYDLKINKAYLLNQTLANIYALLDGKTSVTEICNHLNKHFERNIPDELIWLVLNELNKCNLLENNLPNSYPQWSRREAIKRVGLASMVALPIISSIAAPLSTNAQSITRISCTTQSAGEQGTCPIDFRCVNSTCVACTPNGSPTPGGCTLVDLSGARQCCSKICSLTTNLCSA